MSADGSAGSHGGPAEGGRWGSMAARMLAESRKLIRHFPSDLLANPAHTILLQLFAADVEGRKVGLVDCGRDSDVPEMTLLAWIGALKNEGLVAEELDGESRLRCLRLTEQARHKMVAYLAEVDPDARR